VHEIGLNKYQTPNSEQLSLSQNTVDDTMLFYIVAWQRTQKTMLKADQARFPSSVEPESILERNPDVAIEAVARLLCRHPATMLGNPDHYTSNSLLAPIFTSRITYRTSELLNSMQLSWRSVGLAWYSRAQLV
jgi:hypothetical protein